MILLFIICNFPKNIINIYEGYVEIKVCRYHILKHRTCVYSYLQNGDSTVLKEDWLLVMMTLSHTFLIINSSLNILIYLVKVSLRILDKTFEAFLYELCNVEIYGIRIRSNNNNDQTFAQEQKFREIFSQRKKRGQSFDGFLPKTLQRPMRRKNLRVEKWLKFSKSDSLDSDYSGSTSVIGLSSRQTSQDRTLAGTSSSEWFSSTEKIEETSLSANCRDFHPNCRFSN